MTAADKQEVDEQAEQRRITVWVFNARTSPPTSSGSTRLARRRRIPVVTVTETLVARDAPPSSNGRSHSCEALAQALQRGNGPMSGAGAAGGPPRIGA